MNCTQCGTTVQPGQAFCPSCGRPVTEAPAGTPPAVPTGSTQPSGGALTGTGTAPIRMAQHLKVVAILWIVYSALRLIPGLALMFLGHAHLPFLFAPFPAASLGFMGHFLAAVGLVLAAIGVIGIIAGVGLLHYRPWARILTIVLACISLIHLPFGTALGIYTLWVLLTGGADREYQRLSHQAGSAIRGL